MPFSHDHGSAHHQADGDHQWEGSTEGKAYSEFNHHLAGLCVIFIGLSEVRYGLSASSPRLDPLFASHFYGGGRSILAHF